MTEYPPISSYIAAAGAGEYACATGAEAAAQRYEPEALPDPRETAEELLLAVPWLRQPDVTAILGTLDAAGLTICWRP